MGGPKSYRDPWGQGVFIIKFNKLQCLFITIHVLAALYQYANVHNDTPINITISLQIIRICKLNADSVMRPTVLFFNFTTAPILSV